MTLRGADQVADQCFVLEMGELGIRLPWLLVLIEHWISRRWRGLRRCLRPLNHPRDITGNRDVLCVRDAAKITLDTAQAVSTAQIRTICFYILRCVSRPRIQTGVRCV